MNLTEEYLKHLAEIRATGGAQPETSYYGALATLIDAVGSTLKPRVRCVPQLANAGAGSPDFGLYTSTQFQKASATEPREGQQPERGVVEVKAWRDDAWVTSDGEQVSRYWERYHQVLVTNYRDFVLLGVGPDGTPTRFETFRLAPSEVAFREALRHPRAHATEHGDAFVEFLKRVLLHAAPLRDPKDVAWFLASYARTARLRIERSELPALRVVRDGLAESLGVRFEGERGDHFFRSTFIQTLFYGIFSAWVLWSKSAAGRGPVAFSWRETGWHLKVPMIRALFHQLASPEQLEPLGLVEILDGATQALHRVDRSAFFSKFEETHAVQYFYEPFLQAFDPALRKELGVWYTPNEVVRYMVARVDAALQDDLGIEDGLADPRVHVLDPCCGTGAFLVEVLRRIQATLAAKGDDALVAHDVKKALMNRVFGFEILAAPFVVAHLQLGLMLQAHGTPLSHEREERVGVYLTNALTGWEPTKEPKTTLFPEMAAERDAAERIKRDEPILVILGNPPYNGFAGMAVSEERDLSTAYRTVKQVAAPQGQGLNDLYVRFLRMAERRIVEKTGKGIICYISNYSWLGGLSFTGMRERFLEVFDRVAIDCLNGDKYKTGKLTPDGEPDPSIFSTDYNREGIQVGTSIALFVRKSRHASAQKIAFRHHWGQAKLANLALEAEHTTPRDYKEVAPTLESGLAFQPTTVTGPYYSWPRITELLPTSFPGVKTSRDDFVVDIDKARLIERIVAYFDAAVSDDAMRRAHPSSMESSRRFDAVKTRAALVSRGPVLRNVVRYCYRPMDVRWIYWEPETKLLDEKREEYFPHIGPENLWIESRQRSPKDVFDRGYCTRELADNFANGLSSFFPLRLDTRHLPEDLLTNAVPEHWTPNLSISARSYLDSLAVEQLDCLFFHVVCVMHAPRYREQNADALRQDWPRIPLPADAAALRVSAALGETLTVLLDPDATVTGVNTSTLRSELKALGVVRRIDGAGTLDVEGGDLALTAGWGHAGQSGVTMPGHGRIVERAYTPEELGALADGAKALGLTLNSLLDLLGTTTLDVLLNGVAQWQNVPARVWAYTLGGYQVVKKWLSYRERALLGRDLIPDEARYVTEMVRRIAAILLLGPALDESYTRVVANPAKFPPT